MPASVDAPLLETLHSGYVGQGPRVAEFERNLISERTKEALFAARKRGKSLGRPFILSLEQKQAIDRYLIEGISKLEISRAIGVKSTTPIYNYLRQKK